MGYNALPMTKTGKVGKRIEKGKFQKDRPRLERYLDNALPIARGETKQDRQTVDALQRRLDKLAETIEHPKLQEWVASRERR